MATHTITISASTANPLPLIISDDEGHTASTHDDDANLTTVFKQGDTVRWEIKSGCDIRSIDAIHLTLLPSYQPGVPESTLFLDLPHQANDGTTAWIGIIGFPGATSSSRISSLPESYTITFTMKDGTHHTEDPRLKINQ